MTPATVHGLQRRPFRLDGAETLSANGAWYGGNPFATQLLNAYTILVPGGERFIIRTSREYLGRIGPELKEEVERVFFQEGAHSREHERVLKAMRADGLSLDVFRKLVEWFSYSLVEPLTPLRLRLATAAAIEHHNAVIATFFLNQELLKGIRNGELRRLFLWHFAEEIEHKETVFKVMESISRSWFLRAAGLLVSLGTFLFYLAVGTLLLGFKTSSVLAADFWSELFSQVCSRKGLFLAVVKESLRYLKPKFHPDVEENRTLLASALTELERLGIERPSHEKHTVSRPLPPKFARKMARTLERCHDLQSKHKFFFGRIDGYDQAWVRSDGRRKLNFCTYSYLGLLHHPKVDVAAKRAIERYGTGTHGVRLLGGNLEIHEQLESTIAAFFRREAAITFSSGFMTNLAAIQALVGKGDYVFSDELNHASIVDGCRFSGAEIVKFRHSDMTDLACKLESLPDDARGLIVIEAVYSMDGHIAPLKEVIELRDRQKNTILMVDEAHSLGVLGAHGKGVEEHFDCVGQIDVLMGTLSKTIPGQGGYIAGSQELITHLRYNARGFMFSAALSPVTAAAAQAAFKLIEIEGEARRKQLLSNVRYFIKRLEEEGFDTGNSESAIIPVLLGSEAMAFEMAAQCNLEGVYVMPVIYPAVPKSTERLRMNVTCDHRHEDLEYAVLTLVRARVAVEETAKTRGLVC
jgi:8-amino-7-oxononanoate synthase